MGQLQTKAEVIVKEETELNIEPLPIFNDEYNSNDSSLPPPDEEALSDTESQNPKIKEEEEKEDDSQGYDTIQNNDSDDSSEVLQTASKVSNEDSQMRKYFSMNCDLCAFPFQTWRDVRHHFHQEHKKEPYLKCCDKRFFYRKSILDHTELHVNPDLFK